MLGLPAIAVSQQSRRARDGLPRRLRASTSTPRRGSSARIVDELDDVPLPRGHAAQRQRPRGRARRRRGHAARQAHLPRRARARRPRRGRPAPLLDLRRRPGLPRRGPGTDLAAVAAGRIAVTPIHFDLTDQAGIEALAALRPRRGCSRPAARGGRVTATGVPPRASPSCASSSTTTATATTSSTTPRSATTTTTRCSTSCGRSRPSIPSCVTPDSPDPARRRRRRSPRSRRSRHLQPMLSLANARTRGGAARLGPADAQPPGPRGDRGPGVRVRRRAEDRRAGDLAGLPRRRARARRDPRQRRDRRGRHPQPAHDPDDPAADRRRAAAARGPRRGLHVAAGLRRAQRAPRRGGPVDVHEPAQLGRGHDPPARPQARRRAPAVDVVLRDRRHRGLTLRRTTGTRSSGCASTASRSTATSCELDTEEEVVAQCLDWQERRGALDFEIDGVVVKVDDVELQRRLGVGRARPALGDRLEVPADDRGDDAARASCGTSASSATCTRSACSSPSTSAASRCKLATLHNEEDLARKDVRPGDEVIVLRAGDVIPQVVSPAPHAVERKDRSPPPQPPERCPSCDTPTVKAEGVFTKCPNRDCPGRRWQLLKHFVSRGAMDIDGLGEKQVAPAPAGGPRGHAGRLLPADRRAARGARGLGQDLGRAGRGGDRGLEGAAVRPRAVRARHRGRRLRHRAQPRRSSFRSIDALLAGRRPRRSPRRRGSARSWPSSSTSSSPTPTCAR